MQSDDLGLVGRAKQAAQFIDWLELPDDGSALSDVNPPKVLRDCATAIERLVAERDEAREALRIERMPKCGSCGHRVTDECPRAGSVACWRDYHGGTRAAIPTRARKALGDTL